MEGYEIERKFLLDSIPFELSGFPKFEITQAYVSVRPVIRARRSDDDFILTVKGGGDGIASRELEMPLSSEEYESLLRKAEGFPIDKTRYNIPLGGGLTAELDVYHGRLNGLLTVEVEFDSAEQARAFAPPAWFGADVSLEPRYKNSSLSRLASLSELQDS